MGLAALLAVAPMFAWGYADYLAGTQGRRVEAVDSVAWSQAFSGLLVVTVAVCSGTHIQLSGSLPAVVGGASGALGLVCFYRSMQLARVAVVAPLVASGVGLPVLYGFIIDGGITAPAVVGICIGLVGIFCVTTGTADASRVNPTHAGKRALVLAAAGAVGYGVFLIGLAVSSSADPFNATVVARIGTAMVVVPVIAVRLAPARGALRAIPAPQFVGTLGLLDALGTLAFAAAAHRSNLAVVAVLASLYPAVTVGLAVRAGTQVLAGRERVGIALTLVALPFLAAGG